MTTISIRDFYKDVFGGACPELDAYLDEKTHAGIGHFNVFDITQMYRDCKSKPVMPYNRRTYYKISLINGKNRVEYADKVIDINGFAVLFASPKIPYNYVPQGGAQAGHFCVFTKDFLWRSGSDLMIDKLPIFSPGSDFVYQISARQYKEVENIFTKMHGEIGSDYAYKYDLLRNYLLELIHYGQKLSPVPGRQSSLNASARISSLFIELLERQFPIENLNQELQLKKASDYADTLGVHVNHLNKVLKELTGKTTTEIVAGRILQEAKILLRQTTWNVSEIAHSLGFEEVAHFSNFFKKHTSQSPLHYRD